MTGDLGYNIDLWRMIDSEPPERKVKYNPEKFSGLSMGLNGISAVIFPKGKFNLLGFTEVGKIQQTVDELEKICEKYKIGGNAG